MASLIGILFWATLKLLLVASALLYAGLVLMAYRTDGPRYQLRLDWLDPARSAERLLVWLGVKVVAAVLRAGRSALEILSEAAAEVGEWFIRRRGGQAEALYRSRFL